MSVKKALATLPLVLNACGGGDGDSDPDYTPNEPGKGIWEGGFSAEAISVSGASGAVPQSELDKIDQAGLGLFTSSGRAFFYNEDADVLFADDEPGVVTIGSTHNLVYAPSIYSVGNRTGSVTFDGNPNISTSITGQYSGPITGHYGMNFDQKYFQAANLSQFSGQWTYTSPVGVWTLDFNCPTCSTAGVFSISTDGSSSCTGLGGLSIIGAGSKNEYDVSINLQSCGNTNFTDVYYGAAAVIDGAVANNTLMLGFTNSTNGGDQGFFLKAVKN